MTRLSLFKLRKTEPNLQRTFRSPYYPLVPIIALVQAEVWLVAMAWFNTMIGLIFLGFMATGSCTSCLPRNCLRMRRLMRC